MKSVSGKIREDLDEISKSIGKTGRVVILTAGAAAATLSPGEANGQAGSSPDNPIVLSCGEDIATDLAENINDLGSSRYYQVENLGGINHQFDNNYVYEFTMDDGSPADIDTLGNQDLIIRVYPGEVYKVHFKNEGMNRTFGITFQSCGNEGGEVEVAQLNNSLPAEIESVSGVASGKSNKADLVVLNTENVSEIKLLREDLNETVEIASTSEFDGNSNERQTISLYDRNPSNETSHYKFRVIDTDGTFKDTDVFPITNETIVSSNMSNVVRAVGTGLQFDYVGENTTERMIVDGSGREVSHGILEPGQRFETPINIPNGVYFFAMNSDKGEYGLDVEKFII